MSKKRKELILRNLLSNKSIIDTINRFDGNFLTKSSIKKMDYEDLENIMELYGLPIMETLLGLPILQNQSRRSLMKPIDISSMSGGSLSDYVDPKRLYQKLANYWRSRNCDPKVTRKLEYGEIHPLCMNFEGPGTRIDLPYVRAQKSYNNIDECSKIHDLEYQKAFNGPEHKRGELVRKADYDVLQCYDRYPSEEGYDLGRMGIESKIAIEKLIPFLANRLFGKWSGNKN
jgi:hypothetical protein